MNIIQIWRYPVKSMAGERLEQANIAPGGVEGDRQWAVVDAESGVSLSAKRYPALLECQATMNDGAITITLPNGNRYSAGSTAAARELSDLLQRRVVTRSAAATAAIQHEFPTKTAEGVGEPFLYTPETESFVDCAPLQLLTTATLVELRRLLPDSKIDVVRFRPNFLVQSDETGFIENDWVNGDVKLGPVRCHVYDDTRRCIMVAHGQGVLPRDTRVIRTVIKSNQSRAGIAMRTKESGTVSAGDAVVVDT